MSINQRKSFNKRKSGEFLFTPRSIRSIQTSRELDNQKEENSHVSNREMDLRDTLLISGRPTLLKNQLKNKSGSFLKNIKEQLSTLKTEMDRIITNNSKEASYDNFGILRNLKESNSEENSEVLEEEMEREMVGEQVWRQRGGSHTPVVDESSMMEDIVENRLRFFQEENDMLTNELKRMKGKYRQYKMEAQNEIMVLHQRLVKAERASLQNEEELQMYKREVQQDMAGIKKMLANSTDAKKKLNESHSSKTTPSVKQLQDQNSNLRRNLMHYKQQLLHKQKLLITQTNKAQTLLRHNEKLEKELEQINQQFYTEIDNNPYFKCQESQINFEYSKSKIEQEESKGFFHLEEALMRKDSGGRVSGLKSGLGERGYEELRRANETLVEERNKYKKELQEMTLNNAQKQSTITEIKQQNQSLLQKLSNLQQLAKQTPPPPSPQDTKDQYIKQLQSKLQQMSTTHFNQLTSLRQQIASIASQNPTTSSQSPPSNLWINDDILRQQDLQIKNLKKQLINRNDEIQKLRHAISTLNIEMRNTRTELEISNLKYIKEKKQFAGELEVTIHNFKVEMEILECVNRELGQKIGLICEDRNKKDEFIRDYLMRGEGEEKGEEIEGLFEKCKIEFDGEYLKDQVFREWRMILEFRRQLEELKESKGNQ